MNSYININVEITVCSFMSITLGLIIPLKNLCFLTCYCFASLSLSYLQEDFEFDGQAPFQGPRSTSESTTPMEGENMGGWWPEYSTPDTGVRLAGQFTLACTRHLHIWEP